MEVIVYQIMKTKHFHVKNANLLIMDHFATRQMEKVCLKALFVHIFYYLLTQPFETKEPTTFSLLDAALFPFLLLFLLYQYKIFIADISMGGRQEEKLFITE